MTLKQARHAAIEWARNLEKGGCVSIFRTVPRQFGIEIGNTPYRPGLVQIIHADWVREGFYDGMYR